MFNIRHHIESLGLALRHPALAWQRVTRGVDLRIACGLSRYVQTGYLVGVTRVYDVGANIGEFAKACSIVLLSAEVTCFEPVPATYEVLSRACKKIPQVTVECLAIGERAEMTRMYTSAFSHTDSILAAGKDLLGGWENARANNYVDVKVVTLDEYVPKGDGSLKDVFLKIDVQGYELFVLKGAENILKQCRCVQVEVSIREMYENAPIFPEVWQFLRKRGFILAEVSNILRSPKDNLPVSCDLVFVCADFTTIGTI